MKIKPLISLTIVAVLALTGCAQSDWTLGYPPCEHEDSVGCYWDAERMGNGEGASFVTLEDGEVVYK